MPFADFGETISFGSNLICQLKSKGEKLQFRLLGKPYYEGKHFFKNDEFTSVTDCPRVNEGAECEWCDKFFALMKEAKAADKSVQEKMKKAAREYRAAVNFYYPVIDRDKQQFRIFKTTISVRNAIEAEAAAGTKVLERDFVVIRTEEPGANYYKVTRVDSADAREFSDKEKNEVAKSKKVPLTELIGVGHRTDDSEVSGQAESRHYAKTQAPPTEAPKEPEPVVSDKDYSDDIPF